jgi:ribonuclease P protein component
MASARASPPSAAAGSSSAVAPRGVSVCPPEAPGDARPAAIERLERRGQFLRAARGRRLVEPAFVLQIHPRGDDRIGIGFTASRRIGNAVERNRARRRLKEVARLHLPAHGLVGFDHVLVARKAALRRPFAQLVTDFVDACAAARLAGGAREAGS